MTASGILGRVGNALLGHMTVFSAVMYGAKIAGWWPLARAFRFANVRGMVMYMLLLQLARGRKALLSGSFINGGRIVVAISTWSQDSCGWAYEIGLTLTPEGVIYYDASRE